MAVTIIVTMEVRPEAADGYAKSMRNALKDTREYDGCISINGYRDQDTPTRITAVEQWESRDKYEAYVAWRRSTGLMEKLATVMQKPMQVTYLDEIA